MRQKSLSASSCVSFCLKICNFVFVFNVSLSIGYEVYGLEELGNKLRVSSGKVFWGEDEWLRVFVFVFNVGTASFIFNSYDIIFRC